MAEIPLQVHVIIQIMVIPPRHAHLSMAFFLSELRDRSTMRLLGEREDLRRVQAGGIKATEKTV